MARHRGLTVRNDAVSGVRPREPASRGGQRIVGAVFGGSSWVERDTHMASLLDQSFLQLGVGGARVASGPAVLRTAQASSLNLSTASARQAAPTRQAAQTRGAPATSAD